MRITSNILGEFAAAAKRGITGLFETDINVLPVLQPVVSLRNNLRTGNPSGVALQTSTVYAEDNSLITNGALTSHVVLTLGPGIWEINMQVCYSSNYPSTNNGIDIQINLVGVSALNFMRLFCAQAAGGNVVATRTAVLGLDSNTNISAILNANAAGQTHGAHLSVLASLLV